MLPAHPQQAAEIRLPVHGRLLLRGGGGETLRVRLPALRLGLRPPLRLGGPSTATGGLARKEEENIKYIVK